VPAAIKEIARIKANSNKIGFVKDGGLWYADLPNWPLDRNHLLMVAGADDLLDELSGGTNYVTVQTTQHKREVNIKENEALLKLTQKDAGGLSGSYEVLGDFNTQTVWLCPVINFVFMRVPKFIKFSKV